jgi:hypothetical protein
VLAWTKLTRNAVVGLLRGEDESDVDNTPKSAFQRVLYINPKSSMATIIYVQAEFEFNQFTS